MTPYIPRLLLMMVGASLALGTAGLEAAVAPKGPEELKKMAKHVVSGTVVEVTSKVQKSEMEKAKGIHRDRVYTITVQVKSVAKGDGVKVGESITVKAWTPVKRIPPLPGPQGHGGIPEKGDAVVLFLHGEKGGSYAPILPNGIVLDDGA